MTYLDFVDNLLSAIDATVRDTSGEYARPVSMFEVAKHIVGEAAVEAAPFDPSPLHRSLSVASHDLADMGLVRDTNGHSLRLTANGRLAASQGLRREWPELVEQLPLSDEARQLVTILCDLTEKDHGDFTELYVSDWEELSPLLGEGWTLGKLVGTWQELEQRRAVSGVLVAGGVLHARPTYIGFVLARIGPYARLIRLVQNLVETWEGASVDHKVRLALGTEKEKAELARDVAALANTQVRGERYLVIGFDNTSREFTESFDPEITQDRLEDVLNTRLSAVPQLSVRLIPWSGGTVGVIEIQRNPRNLPYEISRDLTAKIEKGDVFVRRGSHVARADQDELEELKAEHTRADQEEHRS